MRIEECLFLNGLILSKIYSEVKMKFKLLLTAIIVVIASTFGFSQNYYLGVGNGTEQQGKSCASCHQTGNIGQPIYNEWKNTLHAVAQDSLAGTLRYQCLQCHNTGWNPGVDNYGADEYVVADTTQPLGYRITDQAKFDKVKNIQCETCHGPLGTESGNLDLSHWPFADNHQKLNYSAELCGSCHEGEHHPYYDEWKLSRHAASADQAFIVNNKGCVRCHVAQNFALYAKDPAAYKDTIIVTGDDIEPLTCSACHDPHSAKNDGQLRFALNSATTICDQCHTGEIDSVDINTEPHHTTSEALSGSDLFGYQYPGETYINSAHTYAATKRCVNCHVYMTPFNGTLANTGHTFNPRVEACASCHADFYSKVDTSNAEKKFDYRGVQSTTDSLMNVLSQKLASASVEDSSTAAFKEAKYNLLSVEGEGSHGIHNTRLVQKLLRDAIASFNPTAVEKVDGLPSTYELSQNYPNPFNPTTSIRFSIPQAGNVKITVYDALGKEVTTLVNEYRSQGKYKIEWNASTYASGIYFYRIEASKFVSVKKMVLIK